MIRGAHRALVEQSRRSQTRIKREMSSGWHSLPMGWSELVSNGLEVRVQNWAGTAGISDEAMRAWAARW